ncbi:MAG: class I SAM-dependent methyltransferase [Candidatus Hodarchaeales archaeon]
MSDRSFLQDGNVYDIMVNWDKRMAREQPFLQKVISKNVKTVLDVACGTGRHSIELTKLGMTVTGIDIEKSMIDTAKKLSKEVEFIQCDIMSHDLLDQREYDAVISLGNSVALISSEHGYKAVIYRLRELLKDKGGLLIFQILNTEKERNSWSDPRNVVTDNGEYIFVRKFVTDEEYLQLEIIILFRTKGKESWDMKIQGPVNIPRIKHEELLDILKAAGFKKIDLHGDYALNKFDPSSPVDMIIIASN